MLRGLIMTNGEITNIIYDTLMQNKQHKQLDLDKVDNQEVDAKDCMILLDYEDVHIWIDVHVTSRQ